MTTPLSLILLVGVSFLVGGNNAAAAAGTAVGSRLIRKSTGLWITGAGYVLGLLLEGTKLGRLRMELLPSPSETAVQIVLSVAALVFVLASIQRVPVSLTYAIVGAAVGLTLAANLTISLTYLSETILLGLLGPALVLLLSAAMGRLLLGRGGNLWRRVKIYRIGMVLAVFYSAYALGANTFGAILSVIPSSGSIELFIVAIAAVAGAQILGSGPITRTGEELYALGYSSAFISQALGATAIELSTQAGIPLSASRAVTSSALGVGISHPIRILSPRTVYRLVGTWFAVPVVAFTLSYLLGLLVYS